ncbi:hypothetical protein ACF0H5_017507 [Mactra antiquata]
MGDGVIVVAPVKIIAEILSIIAVIWLIVSIAGKGWVVVRFLYYDEYWIWGLWKTCNYLQGRISVCIQEEWITVCLVLSIMALIFSVAGAVCGILGIRDTVLKTNIFYTVAAGFLIVVAILEFVVVVTFPVKFGQDIIMVESVRRWEFDWAYGFAWGGLVFSIGAAVFFLLPNKHVYRTTRTKQSQNNNYAMARTEPDV